METTTPSRKIEIIETEKGCRYHLKISLGGVFFMNSEVSAPKWPLLGLDGRMRSIELAPTAPPE